MNCDSLLHLLDEVPIPRWTHDQQADAREHCRSCDDCRAQLELQQALFIEFGNMHLPEYSQTLTPELEGAPHRNIPSFITIPGILSIAAVVFLCFGSLFQFFRESGFSLYWIADGRRLESVATLLYSTPALSAALVLVGLIYCLAWDASGLSE